MLENRASGCPALGSKVVDNRAYLLTRRCTGGTPCFSYDMSVWGFEGGVVRGGFVLICIRRFRRTFMYERVRGSSRRQRVSVDGTGGRVIDLRGHSRRLSLLFGQACRSVISNELDRTHFSTLTSRCRGRRTRIETEVSRLRTSIVDKRRRCGNLGQLLTGIQGCASPRRLATRVLGSLISGVLIRTPSGDDKREGRGVRVCCRTINVVGLPRTGSSRYVTLRKEARMGITKWTWEIIWSYGIAISCARLQTRRARSGLKKNN